MDHSNSEYLCSIWIGDAESTDLDVVVRIYNEFSADAAVTRENVEEMIAAALDRQMVIRTQTDEKGLDQYQKKIAVLENERDETSKKIANLEGQRDGAFAATKILSREKDEALGKIAALEKERDEALESNKVLSAEHAEGLVTIRALGDKVSELRDVITLVDNQNEAIWDEANAKIELKQKELDSMLATMGAKEAKVTHLELQLAKIHSLSKSDETVISTSDLAGSEDGTDLASHNNISPGTWVDPWPRSNVKWETGSWD